MQKREARIFYIPKGSGRKAIIVYDRGHAGGDVHVYECKESYSTKEIEEEIKKHLQIDKVPSGEQNTIIQTWVEKKFGLPISWKLVEE